MMASLRAKLPKLPSRPRLRMTLLPHYLRLRSLGLVGVAAVIVCVSSLLYFGIVRESYSVTHKLSLIVGMLAIVTNVVILARIWADELLPILAKLFFAPVVEVCGSSGNRKKLFFLRVNADGHYVIPLEQSELLMPYLWPDGTIRHASGTQYSAIYMTWRFL